jgi:SNF2 family DNA or RNA helicase
LLNLPPKNVIDEFVEMDDKQSKFYNNIKAGIKDDVDKVVLKTANLLAMI